MPNLDDPKLYDELDPTGLRGRIRALPDDCESAWQAARAFAYPVYGSGGSGRAGTASDLVIGGMGGSAIAGDLVADLAAPEASVPITVVRGFDLPYLLGRRSQAILCSYSGNTEETLSLYRQAVQADARVLVIAGGGALREEAEAQGVPILTVETAGEPRSAVGYNLLLLLGAVSRLGVAETSDDEVRAAVDTLRRLNETCGEDTLTDNNPAKQLALEMRGKIVVVYGGGVLSGVARRWKTQLNENAGAWSFFEAAPELLHNAIEAYAAPAGLSRHIMVVNLRPKTADAAIRKRYDLVEEMLRRNGVPHLTPDVPEGAPLPQLLGALALGDWASYYLALLDGVDPSPTPAIRLGRSGLL
jgi:glucose/mannose-6-phosphate isomerase